MPPSPQFQNFLITSGRRRGGENPFSQQPLTQMMTYLISLQVMNLLEFELWAWTSRKSTHKQMGRGIGQVGSSPLAACSASHGVAITVGVFRSLFIRPGRLQSTHNMQISKHSTVSLLPGNSFFSLILFSRWWPWWMEQPFPVFHKWLITLRPRDSK